MINYPIANSHGCSSTSTEKIWQRSMVANKSMNYNRSGIQTWLNKLLSEIEMSFVANVINGYIFSIVY
jgi:hypothetical protein